MLLPKVSDSTADAFLSRPTETKRRLVVVLLGSAIESTSVIAACTRSNWSPALKVPSLSRSSKMIQPVIQPVAAVPLAHEGVVASGDALRHMTTLLPRRTDSLRA